MPLVAALAAALLTGLGPSPSGRDTLWAQQVSVETLLGPIVENPADPRYADVAAAVEQFNAGDFAGTQTMLEEAVGKLPEIPPADAMMAQLLFLRGRPQSALQSLEAATAAAPNDPEAYLMLGDVALAEQRHTEAQLLYAHAEKLAAAYDKNPRRQQRLQIGAYSGISAAAAARRQWDEVVRPVTAWLKLDPNSAQAKARLGRALFFQGSYQEAYTAFQQAYQLAPETTRPEVNMGLLYEQLAEQGDVGRRESAKRAMLTAVREDPDTLDTRLAVTHWALDACELDIAEENAEAALRLAPDSVEALLHAGLVARQQGKPAKAQTHLEAAHLQAPSDAAILMQLALALLEENQPDAAKRGLDYAQLAVAAAGDRAQPMGRDAAVTLAWAFQQTGRPVDAMAAAQAAVQAGPLSAESSYYAASIFHQAGNSDLARQLLGPVLQSSACFPNRGAAQALAEKLRANN